jgi:hypothetical protein
MTRPAIRCRARAAVIVAFWLLYAALPLLVSLQRADAMACCRGDGAHRCFLRPRVPAREPKLSTANKVCEVATAKATPQQAAVLAVPAPRVQFARSTGLALFAVWISFVTPRSTCPPRAPPVA